MVFPNSTQFDSRAQNIQINQDGLQVTDVDDDACHWSPPSGIALVEFPNHPAPVPVSPAEPLPQNVGEDRSADVPAVRKAWGDETPPRSETASARISPTPPCSALGSPVQSQPPPVASRKSAFLKSRAHCTLIVGDSRGSDSDPADTGSKPDKPDLTLGDLSRSRRGSTDGGSSFKSDKSDNTDEASASPRSTTAVRTKPPRMPPKPTVSFRRMQVPITVEEESSPVVDCDSAPPPSPYMTLPMPLTPQPKGPLTAGARDAYHGFKKRFVDCRAPQRQKGISLLAAVNIARRDLEREVELESGLVGLAEGDEREDDAAHMVAWSNAHSRTSSRTPSRAASPPRSRTSSASPPPSTSRAASPPPPVAHDRSRAGSRAGSRATSRATSPVRREESEPPCLNRRPTDATGLASLAVGVGLGRAPLGPLGRPPLGKASGNFVQAALLARKQLEDEERDCCSDMPQTPVSATPRSLRLLPRSAPLTPRTSSKLFLRSSSRESDASTPSTSFGCSAAFVTEPASRIGSFGMSLSSSDGALDESGQPQPQPPPPCSGPVVQPESFAPRHRRTPSSDVCLDDVVIGAKIGQGAYAEVFHGRLAGKVAAIKKYKTEDMTAEDMAQFRNEVAIMRKLHHPGIVELFGSSSTAPDLAVLMEYCQRGSLYDVLKRKSSLLTPQIRAQIALGVAEALQYMHGLRPAIVHRDIKPQNILMTQDFMPKISDFSISYEVGCSTQNNQCGSILYMSPELIKGTSSGPKCDVYGFSMVLYELVTGKAPYGELRTQPMKTGFAAAFQDLRPSLEGCPEAWRDLIQRCWAPDARARPTFEQIVGELRFLISTHAASCIASL